MCLQQSGVYSLPQIETTMFIADRQRAGRVWRRVQPSFVHWCWRCRVVGYSYSIRSSRLVVSNTTYSASNKCDGDTAYIRIYRITEYSQATQACEWCARWLGGSTRCSFLDVSDIHISVWHQKHFRIAVWYLADDCLAISAMAGYILRVVDNMEWLVYVYNAHCNNYNALYKITIRRNLRKYAQNDRAFHTRFFLFPHTLAQSGSFYGAPICQLVTGDIDSVE